MGRKRAFDYDEVIDRATRLFWAKGYSGTSLRDLLEVMQIGESSFYNTVGSKQGLYLECLRHYNDTVIRRRWDALFAEPLVRDGVRAFFRTVLDDIDDPAVPDLCLMAGSLSADVLSADELGEYVLGEMRGLAGRLAGRLRMAVADGELAADFDVEVVTHVIITFLQGLFRVAGVLLDRPQLDRQVEAVLTGIGL